MPKLDIGRVKIGHTRRLSYRLKQHRTACPYAALLACWVVRDVETSEDRAHALASRLGQQIGETLVFDFGDGLWDAVKRIHTVFELEEHLVDSDKTLADAVANLTLNR